MIKKTGEYLFMSTAFTLLHRARIAEIDSEALLYQHQPTGARLLSLVNNDENKVFGITFRTPPADSTGVAHILEHSVLCGSKKYPVKEPFVELLKGSLQTFLNAFTFPDKTCYPVASQNVTDFYNLIDVYLDAVFHPRLTPQVFAQEGWHYELGEDGGLSIQGVVYNEMKGAYASPDGLLSEHSQQSLFPETTYGLDSGGHPEKIPELTFEGFMEFHRRYYHPSNAFIFFSGNDDPERRLAVMEQYLREFNALDVDSRVGMQPPLARPARLTRHYPVSPGEDASGQAMLTMNWMLGDTLDVERNLAWRVLEYLLVEMPSSPLRKALIDSGLGDDLAGVGLECELRQMYFSTGLRGMRAEDAPRVESLILETLQKLVDQGIAEDLAEAALNSVEFRLRERNSGRFPRGLAAMLQALTFWLHDADPMQALAFEAPLRNLKERLKASFRSGRGYFADLIQNDLLTNAHHSVVLLLPDKELGAKMQDREAARLAKAAQELGPEGRRDIAEQTKALRAWQETPDTAQNLAAIPCLTRNDLAAENTLIPRTEIQTQDGRMLFHQQATSGIAHLDLGFNLQRLAQEDLAYVPLLGKALVEIGTHSEDFARFSTRVNCKTGGIWPETFVATRRAAADHPPATWLFLRSKAMRQQVPELLDILRKMLFEPDLGNQPRFMQLVLEEKAGFERMLVPRGHLLVNSRLRAGFTLADWAAEQMGGVSYLFFLRILVNTMQDSPKTVRQRLESILSRLLDRDSMVLNVTTQEDIFSRFEPDLRAFLTQIPLSTSRADWTMQAPKARDPREARNAWEGLGIAAPVNYVGQGLRWSGQLPCSLGAAMVVTRYLRTAWLWERIRVKGGAYGAFCLFDAVSGGLTMVSYRDPHIVQTLKAFEATAAYLRDLRLDAGELNKAVVGAIGDMDAHLLPDAKGHTSLRRFLTNQDDAYRQHIREEILACDQADFTRMAEVLDAFARQGRVVAMGGRDRLEQAAVEMGREWQLTHVL